MPHVPWVVKVHGVSNGVLKELNEIFLTLFRKRESPAVQFLVRRLPMEDFFVSLSHAAQIVRKQIDGGMPKQPKAFGIKGILESME